jgi:hypothetical protein
MHFDEISSLLIVSPATSSCGSSDPVIISYTSPPTMQPTPVPSLLHNETASPTPMPSFLQNETASTTEQVREGKNPDFLLAIILAAIIISVIGMVAAVSRVFIVKIPGELLTTEEV